MVIYTLANSCIDSYWPQLGTKYDEVLVVDGMIHSGAPPYKVVLSASSPVNEPKLRPLSGCAVLIHDDQGNSEWLMENEPGIYYTSVDGIQGEVHHNYNLEITTPNGKVYATAPQKIEEALALDSVYWTFETREEHGLDHWLEGYQIYLNTSLAQSDSTYLLWNLTSTYKYNSTYRVRYVFDGQMHNVKTTDTLYTCWRTDKIKDIFAYNTLHLTEPKLMGYPLNYVSTETRELSIRYSLLIEQLVVDEDAYRYWTTIKEQQTEQGSLYTKQPHQIMGNVFNTIDDTEVVFGYFVVGGHSHKRIFIDSPRTANFYYPTECNLYTEELYVVLQTMRPQWPVLLAAKFTEYGRVPALPGSKSCIDCTENGGNTNPPDFWED